MRNFLKSERIEMATVGLLAAGAIATGLNAYDYHSDAAEASKDAHELDESTGSHFLEHGHDSGVDTAEDLVIQLNADESGYLRGRNVRIVIAGSLALSGVAIGAISAIGWREEQAYLQAQDAQSSEEG